MGPTCGLAKGSGFCSNYLEQDDASSIRLRFLDAAAAELATAEIGGQAFVLAIPATAGQRNWGQDSLAGGVPVGTSSVVVEVLASDADVNHDGYLDNVAFSISQIPEPTSIVLIGVAFASGVLLFGRRKE